MNLSGRPLTGSLPLNFSAILTAGLFIAGCATTPDQGGLDRYELTDDEADRLRRPLLSAIEDREISGGSLLVTVDGRVVFEESHGVADIDTARPFSTDEPVMIASSTKPLAAATFAILDERGVLDLDERLDAVLDEWREARLEDGRSTRAPTIRELLSHTSGMPSPQAWGSIYRALMGMSDAPTNDDLSRLIAEQGLAFRPGTDYRYGGVGLSVAARAAEVAWQDEYGEAKFFADIMGELLLEPLELTATTFYPSPDIISTMPHRYRRTERGLVAVPKPQYRPHGTMANAGGGLISTSRDLAAFYEMLRRRGHGPNGPVMSAAAIDAMLTAQRGAPGFDMPDASSGYGLGTMLGFGAGGQLVQVGHGGALGTDAHLRIIEDRIVVLIIQTPGGQVRDFQADLRQALGDVFD